MFPQIIRMPTGQAKALRNNLPVHGGSTAPQPSGFTIHLPIYMFTFDRNQNLEVRIIIKTNATIIIIMPISHWRVMEDFQTLSYKLSHPEDT